ncbi:MAG: alpha/beta fold hydrolase [Nitrospirales bacterium]|nr:alpha/beta hydrolase [Nitrospirales bacterium]
MDQTTRFELPGSDGKLIVGDLIPGEDRQLLFVTGFLSKRWGNKSQALADLCRERHWGFCCFDFRGNGDSEGAFAEYTLSDWLDDARSVTKMLADGPPVTIIGSSLGGWLAWLLGQEFEHMQQLMLLAPAFNMMGKRAQDIAPERRQQWKTTGWMPWDDDAVHKDYPLSWKWVEESEALWVTRFVNLRRIPTCIVHGLQDTVILPKGSWEFTEQVLTKDPQFPIELLFKTGGHRFSSPANLHTFLDLAAHIQERG